MTETTKNGLCTELVCTSHPNPKPAKTRPKPKPARRSLDAGPGQGLWKALASAAWSTRYVLLEDFGHPIADGRPGAPGRLLRPSAPPGGDAHPSGRPGLCGRPPDDHAPSCAGSTTTE